jgi:hypothetical protein
VIEKNLPLDQDMIKRPISQKMGLFISSQSFGFLLLGFAVLHLIAE